MAIKTWIATTASTWATAASWSPSGIPAAADDVIFNGTSNGDCSIGLSASCRSLVMTGYGGIFSGTAGLAITGSNDGSLAGSGSTLVLSAVGTTSNFTYSGTITFTATNGSGYIYSNAKQFSGQLTFNSASGVWQVQDAMVVNSNMSVTVNTLLFNSTLTVTGTVTLAAGSFYSNTSNFYIGNISTSNSVARTVSCLNLYLTGAGTLIAATTTTNLGWGASNIYVWGSQTSARTLTFNTVVYPSSGYCELGGTGSGNITLAPGTTGNPRVGVTNTGGAIVSFSTGNINELVFSGGTNVVWTNAAAQSLTIDGDLTLTSTMGTPTLTPSFTFRGLGSSLANTSKITLAGKSLVTGFMTLNDTLGPGAGLGTFTFVDAFTSNNGVTITSGVVNINANFNITPTNATLTFTAGTLTVNNGANVTCGLFASNNTNTRVLNMGWGTWTITGTGTVWNINGTAGITLNAQQSRILINNTSVTTNLFTSTGSLTYYTIEYARGGGGGRLDFTSTTLTTIANFIDNTSTAAHFIGFQSGQWNFYKFNVRGSAGALITISRSNVTSPVINKVGQGIVPYCDYLNISSLTFTATPANTWYAGANSTGSGGGWVMTAAPSSQSLLGAGGVG